MLKNPSTLQNDLAYQTRRNFVSTKMAFQLPKWVLAFPYLGSV